MSEWVQTHLPCPECGSSDAYSINDRGWGKCFSCGVNRKEDEDEPDKPRGKQVATDKPLVPFGEYRALTKRKLTEETREPAVRPSKRKPPVSGSRLPTFP